MKVTALTRRRLAARRESREMESRGFKLHEVDWEILRGFRQDEVILEAKISVCGKFVWTRTGKKGNA